jgi:YegS/Rv2252/BmrU family lipid kinase
MSKQKILFVVNPISGGKSKRNFGSLVLQNLDLKTFDYEILHTEYAGHAKEILAQRREIEEMVVAVGGDGTVNEVASSLIHSQKAMSIIPLGSGNGLARHLGFSLNVVKALRQMASLQEIGIDSCVLNGHFFLSIAGIGFDSLIAKEFSRSARRGFLGYAFFGIREFFRYEENHYRIHLDGKQIKRKAALVTFANSNQFGYNTKISPESSITDGLIDVCILRKPTIFQVPRLLWKIWRNKAHHSPLLEIIRAKGVIVDNNDVGFANIDGESVAAGTKIHVTLQEKSLKIMIPIYSYGKEKRF